VCVCVTQYTNNLQNCQNEWTPNRQYDKGQKCGARSSHLSNPYYINIIIYFISDFPVSCKGISHII